MFNGFDRLTSRRKGLGGMEEAGRERSIYEPQLISILIKKEWKAFGTAL